MLLPLLVLSFYHLLFDWPKMTNSNTTFDSVFYLKEFKKKHQILTNKFLQSSY